MKWKPASAEELARRGIGAEANVTTDEPSTEVAKKAPKKPKGKSKE